MWIGAITGSSLGGVPPPPSELPADVEALSRVSNWSSSLRFRSLASRIARRHRRTLREAREVQEPLGIRSTCAGAIAHGVQSHELHGLVCCGAAYR